MTGCYTWGLGTQDDWSRDNTQPYYDRYGISGASCEKFNPDNNREADTDPAKQMMFDAVWHADLSDTLTFWARSICPR